MTSTSRFKWFSLDKFTTCKGREVVMSTEEKEKGASLGEHSAGFDSEDRSLQVEELIISVWYL